MRKELRASLEDARTRVAELETQVLDSKLEIDSLKASPVVSDEVDCVDCSIFLADLALFKEKHASKCEEQDRRTRICTNCGQCYLGYHSWLLQLLPLQGSLPSY
jgi:hypothetical protein